MNNTDDNKTTENKDASTNSDASSDDEKYSLPIIKPQPFPKSQPGRICSAAPRRMPPSLNIRSQPKPENPIVEESVEEEETKPTPVSQETKTPCVDKKEDSCSSAYSSVSNSYCKYVIMFRSPIFRIFLSIL